MSPIGRASASTSPKDVAGQPTSPRPHPSAFAADEACSTFGSAQLSAGVVVAPQRMLFHAVTQRVARDAEGAGGERDIAGMLAQADMIKVFSASTSMFVSSAGERPARRDWGESRKRQI